MKVSDYLEKIQRDGYSKYTDVTFLTAVARKDENSPGHHFEYATTSIRTIAQWEASDIMDYYILNNHQCPVDWLSGACWKARFESGNLLSLLVVSKKDLELVFTPEQATSIIDFIDEKIDES